MSDVCAAIAPTHGQKIEKLEQELSQAKTNLVKVRSLANGSSVAQWS